MSYEWCFNILLCTFRWKTSNGSLCFGNSRNKELFCGKLMFTCHVFLRICICIYFFSFLYSTFCCFPFGCARTHSNCITAPFMLHAISDEKKYTKSLHTSLTFIYLAQEKFACYSDILSQQKRRNKKITDGGSKGHSVHIRIEKKTKRFGSNLKAFKYLLNRIIIIILHKILLLNYPYLVACNVHGNMAI